MVRSPRTFVERPPASSTKIPSGARSHGFEVQSSATSIAPSATSMCCQKPPNERLLRAASSKARIFAWSCAFLLGPVPVVKTMALLKLATFETWSRVPSRYAPSLRYAHQRECNRGALTIAATISPFDSIPISVPKVGIPRENSCVPPIGPMIRRDCPEALGAFVPPPPISSPRTSSGNPLAATFARAISSTARSACVTAVPSPFLSTRNSSARKYRIAIASASFAIASSSAPYVSPCPITSPANSVGSKRQPLCHGAFDFQLSSDLTPTPRTPSIQSYRNVCSRQYRNRAGPHSGGATRRSRSPQTRATRDRAQVWRESGHAVARFFRGAVSRRFEHPRGAEVDRKSTRLNSSHQIIS